MRRKLLTLAATFGAALLMASGASAQPAVDYVYGFGTANGASFAAAAASGPQGQNPIGLVLVHGTLPSDNGPVTRTFHGDVSRGCLIVTGNHAAVIGRLPENEQVRYSPFGTVEYAAIFVEDNGRPRQGHPVDRVSETLFLKASSAMAFCALGSFVWPPSQTFTLDSGDFVVHDAP
jgi:hypothetical protein